MSLLKTILGTLCCMTALYGCQNKLLTVYKIDIQQGNALEAEDVETIKLGMSKEQVLFVLGTPLVVDSFHPDRWDYVYLFTPGYAETQRRQLTIIFDRNEIIEMIKHNVPETDAASGEAGETESGEDTDQ